MRAAEGIFRSGVLGAGWTYRPAGVPKDCSEGMIGTQPVRSCKICFLVMRAEVRGAGMTMLGARVHGLMMQRVVVPVTFRRSLSYEQPDVVPSDPSQGVWATDPPPRPKWGEPSNLPVEVLSYYTVQPEDLTKHGLNAEWGRHGLSLPGNNYMESLEFVSGLGGEFDDEMVAAVEPCESAA